MEQMEFDLREIQTRMQEESINTLRANGNTGNPWVAVDEPPLGISARSKCDPLY